MSDPTFAGGADQARRLLFLPNIFMLLGLSACGDPTTPSASPVASTSSSESRAAAASPSGEVEKTGDSSPHRLVNALTFEATGDTAGKLSSDGTDLMLTGGCLDRNVIGMSFTRGQITDKNLFQVRLRTADSIDAGETGTFAVSELSWYNGQFKPEDLPTEANILVPDAYEGSGTLTLTRHDPGGGNGRMAGTVEGTVLQAAGGKEATIKASFDINIGCVNAAIREVTGQ